MTPEMFRIVAFWWTAGAVIGGLTGFAAGLMLARSRGKRQWQQTYDLVVRCVPYLLGIDEWEDHHAIDEIATKLGVSHVDAAIFLLRALEKYPYMRVIKTEKGFL